MVFQIWDTESANMVGAFPTADAAFRAVCEAVEVHGPGYVATWVLEHEDEQGHITTLGEGSALLERARKHVAA